MATVTSRRGAGGVRADGPAGLRGQGGRPAAPGRRRRRGDRGVPGGVHPGTPIWIDSRPIWDGDEEWYAMLVDQAVVVPGPVTEALGAAARAPAPTW